MLYLIMSNEIRNDFVKVKGMTYFPAYGQKDSVASYEFRADDLNYKVPVREDDKIFIALGYDKLDAESKFAKLFKLIINQNDNVIMICNRETDSKSILLSKNF